MLTSLVYLGEHWVIDGIVGWAIVGASFWFWNWFEARQRRKRAQRSLSELAALC
jgi:membrane-associated phospholipid phosphatase